MKHACAARGCRAQIPLHLLMCRPHWYMVSQMTRLKVLRHYQKGQEQDLSIITSHYMDAMRLAIQEVAVAEGKVV